MCALGDHTYLMLPSEDSHATLSRGVAVDVRCRIVPTATCASLRDAEDSVLTEVARFKKSVEHMANALDAVVVFVETVKNPTRVGAHTFVECVPVSNAEIGSLSMYAKQAFDELVGGAEHEVRELGATTDLATLFPPSVPYVTMQWGNSGFACALRDPKRFDERFASDVLSSLFERERTFSSSVETNATTLIRDKKRMEAFVEVWKSFDWTLDLD